MTFTYKGGVSYRKAFEAYACEAASARVRARACVRARAYAFALALYLSLAEFVSH